MVGALLMYKHVGKNTSTGIPRRSGGNLPRRIILLALLGIRNIRRGPVPRKGDGARPHEPVGHDPRRPVPVVVAVHQTRGRPGPRGVPVRKGSVDEAVGGGGVRVGARVGREPQAAVRGRLGHALRRAEGPPAVARDDLRRHLGARHVDEAALVASAVSVPGVLRAVHDAVLVRAGAGRVRHGRRGAHLLPDGGDDGRGRVVDGGVGAEQGDARDEDLGRLGRRGRRQRRGGQVQLVVAVQVHAGADEEVVARRRVRAQQQRAAARLGAHDVGERLLVSEDAELAGIFGLLPDKRERWVRTPICLRRALGSSERGREATDGGGAWRSTSYVILVSICVS